jgi:hypothetical protein
LKKNIRIWAIIFSPCATMTSLTKHVAFPVMGPPSQLPMSGKGIIMTRKAQTPTRGKTTIGKASLLNVKLMKKGNRTEGPPRGYRRPRNAENIRECIKRNPRYRNMRTKGILTPIVKNFMETTNCLSCRTPFKSACGRWEKRSAIDHHHDFEKTSTVCYRGRLCQRCNTTEGGRSPATWMRVVHHRTPTADEVKWAGEYKDGDDIRTKLSF